MFTVSLGLMLKKEFLLQTAIRKKKENNFSLYFVIYSNNLLLLLLFQFQFAQLSLLKYQVSLNTGV